MAIKRAVEWRDHRPPDRARPQGIYGTIFTAAGRSGADLRNVTIFAAAEVDGRRAARDSAVMAVLDAMACCLRSPFVHESLIGTKFSGRV